MEKHEMAQMLEQMLARMDANRKADKAEIKANHAKADADMKTMLAKMDANQAKEDANIKTTQDKMEANMGSMQAELKSAIKDLKINGEETMACQETMEARLEGKEEPASEEMKPEVAYQEVSREHATVMPVAGLRKQRRGRKQAAGRRKEPKELNQCYRVPPFLQFCSFRHVLSERFTAVGFHCKRVCILCERIS
jgi:hypothetical protein